MLQSGPSHQATSVSLRDYELDYRLNMYRRFGGLPEHDGREDAVPTCVIVCLRSDSLEPTTTKKSGELRGLSMTQLPPILIDAIKDQRAILFLGSGASRDAQHPKGDAMPLGDKLRDLICDNFFAGALKAKPLTAVAAMAANEAGLLPFQKYIHDLFEPFQPADFHRLIPQFRWKAIATTNFDLIVERAYAAVPNSLQNLVKTVKDGDLFDRRMSGTTQPVGFYKLHGCIDSYTDEAIPLILSNEQYASYEQYRRRFYDRFRDLGYEYHVIFAGYGINDPHIQRLLFDLTAPEIGRPMYYHISPGVDPIEARYWAKHRITCVDASFADFLQSADHAIPTLARQIQADIGGGELSIRKHYRVAAASESSGLQSYLDTDVTHVHAGMAALPQNPVEFYRGFDRGWGCILQNLDAKRTFSDSVLIDAVLVTEDAERPSELYMLKGPAGNGKSVSLKRIAWEAAVNYDQLVLYSNSPAGLRIDPREEIYRLTGKRALLFVDRVALVRAEMRELLQASRSRSVPLSIIGAERNNEWNIYCEFLERYLRQEFPVRYLSETEIGELIALLERHNALGVLKDKDPVDRVYAFTKTAERQLLVALHEATLGVPFEEIVLDEYRRIEPPAAQRLYLEICALHQFGAPVRAGLISRASGITFEQFGRELISPLENVVLVLDDKHTGDVFYRSRHEHVASLVFNQALPKPEEKFDLLVGLLAAINVDYSSDRETFSRLIKGRGITELFPNVELGRLFYDRVEQADPGHAFVFHQRAVFEMNHDGGSLALAEAAAQRAFNLNPNSHSIQHTQGEAARRLANDTDDPLRKQMFRRIAREKVGGEPSLMSEYDYFTLARLAIDELREEANSLDVSAEESPPTSFIEAAKDAETAIQRGLQSFPESSEILSAEASFRDLLHQTKKALQALEKAFVLNPRQDWLAVRLARRYEDGLNWQESIRVLEACLHDNPSSKMAHLQYARVLMKSRGATSSIAEHLKRSFTEGDNHYEAQFWYARELSLQGHFEESTKIFRNLHDRAPGRFRPRAAAPAEDSDGNPIVYEGRVERFEEGYAFVRIAQFPNAVFASRAETDQDEWERLNSGLSVRTHVAFCRRGARATNVRAA